MDETENPQLGLKMPTCLSFIEPLRKHLNTCSCLKSNKQLNLPFVFAYSEDCEEYLYSEEDSEPVILEQRFSTVIETILGLLSAEHIPSPKPLGLTGFELDLDQAATITSTVHVMRLEECIIPSTDPLHNSLLYHVSVYHQTYLG